MKTGLCIIRLKGSKVEQNIDYSQYKTLQSCCVPQSWPQNHWIQSIFAAWELKSYGEAQQIP